MPYLYPPVDLQPSEGKPSYVLRKKQNQGLIWYLASWNVCSLLEREGPIETARKCREVADAKDRRIDQVVGQLERYCLVVAAQQETKWFGDNVYAVGNSIVLTAGRLVPENDDVRQRGEGVALVLSGPAISGWKA